MDNKLKIFLCFIGIILFSYGSVEAQNSALSNAAQWLKSNQNADYSWGDTTALESTRCIDSSEVVKTLKFLDIKDVTYENALSWLSSIISDNNYISANKLISLSNSSVNFTQELNNILESQNEDGGWGGTYGVQNTIIDTTFNLLALKVANFTGQDIISSALGFLISTQNPDGGWGFYPSACSGCEADSSNVYMTAMVLDTLAQYKSTYNLQTPINNAVAYLQTKQNSDGGFGSSSSTVYETSLAFLALVESGALGTTSPTVVQNAITYLTSTQLSNGSWNDDPYSTALALRALANIKPNLSIFSTDLVFSNPTPKVGDTISIAATIHNEGPVVANNILVQFYDGDPSSGGVLIGETTIPIINASSSF